MYSYTFHDFGTGENPDDYTINSFNIGVGPVWHKTQSLASGITAGQTLPSDYNDVKFDKGDEVSWMLMLSFGF